MPPVIIPASVSVRLLQLTYTFQVADFGLSKPSELVDQNTSMSTVHAASISPRWLAPELLRGEDAGRPSDVYSFGIIMWELLTWQLPWAGTGAHTIPVKVVQGDRPAVPDRGRLPGPNNHAFREGVYAYIALMCRCWSDDPRDRPGFADVVRDLEDLLGRLDHTDAENRQTGAPPHGDTDGPTGPICCICFENVPDIRLHPCGHAVCRGCSTEMLLRLQRSCPVCRQPVTDRQDLYL